MKIVIGEKIKGEELNRPQLMKYRVRPTHRSMVWHNHSHVRDYRIGMIIQGLSPR